MILVLAAWLPWSAAAQDARQRTTATIIADALNQLPAAKQQTYDSVMKDLASTGAEGIVQLADMLVPADQGKNATLEYALYAVVSYVTAPGKDAERAGVRKGLMQAIDKCTDMPNKAFLMNMLQRCAVAEDAPFFVKYANDNYLADWGINGLALVEGTDDAILNMMKNDSASREKLAYAAGEHKLQAAESILIGWLKDADTPTQKAVYHALGIAGTAKSLPILGAAARAVKYDWVPETDVTASYLRLIQNLAARNDKAAYDAAKALLKATDKAYVRGAALQIIVNMDGKKAQALVLAALKDKNRDYRVNALRLSESFADDTWYAAVTKILKGKGEQQMKADILNWLGTNHVSSQIDAVVANINSSDEETALAAIAAAGKIGGDVALEALVGQLNGKNAGAATKALLSFNGKVNDNVIKALDADKTTRIAALGIASTRSMEAAADKVFALLESDNAETCSAAYKALAGVVGPSDFTRLSELIEKDGGKHTAEIQKALKNALVSLPADKQFAMVMPSVNKSASPSLYYPVLAQVGSTEAIAEIRKGYEGNCRQAAYEALLTIDSQEMLDVLYEMALKDKANSQVLLNRYTNLVAKSNQTPIQKYQLYAKALEQATDVKLQNRLIGLLGGTHTYQALLVVEKYMDNQPTSEAAAGAVRTIVSKNISTLGGEQIRKMLEKAITCFEAIGDADAGYAVNDIKAMLEKLPEAETSPKFELSAEEAKDGFEVLFDGEDMSQWTGNTVDYVPMNGAIFVSARYGNGGNLYTRKEYSDFIFRFEFCFMREGVNNGVGIRTPMGVDAAYEGMEIQILDHDAPIYKNLREYQQHGSVYGIIPAKRMKFPKLGTWNTEEIMVKGDRIKVTVNDEVILDGNIRKACKGNNVSKDGSKTNPYTVDKKNHPGLFNKKGHIGFLGHGAGVKFRNIRILDLSK